MRSNKGVVTVGGSSVILMIKPGAETHMPSGCGRKRPLLSLYVGVAITARHQHTAAVTDPLRGSVACGDVKRPTGAYSHFAHVGALFCPARDHRPHQIAGLEAFDALVLLGVGTRKTVLIHATHLPAPMPRRGNLKWDDAFHREALRRTLPNTGGITPMRLGQPASQPIK